MDTKQIDAVVERVYSGTFVSEAMFKYAPTDPALTNALILVLETQAKNFIATEFIGRKVYRVLHGKIRFEEEMTDEMYIRNEKPRYQAIMQTDVWVAPEATAAGDGVSGG